MDFKRSIFVIAILLSVIFHSGLFAQGKCDELLVFDKTDRDTFGVNHDKAGAFIFSESNVSVSIDSMYWTATTRGYFQVRAELPRCGFGAGKIIRFDNAALIFDFTPMITTQLTFIFLDMGGMENLIVNNQQLYIVNDFTALPADVAPGVSCKVNIFDNNACEAGGLIGEVNLQGAISDLFVAGQELWIDSLCVALSSSDIPNKPRISLPATPVLAQNYPNPFNSSTVISYTLPAGGSVGIRIYDALGKEVATITPGLQSAGHHNVKWQADNLPSGIYLYRLAVNGQLISTKKMLYIR